MHSIPDFFIEERRKLISDPDQLFDLLGRINWLQGLSMDKALKRAACKVCFRKIWKGEFRACFIGLTKAYSVRSRRAFDRVVRKYICVQCLEKSLDVVIEKLRGYRRRVKKILKKDKNLYRDFLMQVHLMEMDESVAAKKVFVKRASKWRRERERLRNLSRVPVSR